MNTYTERLQLFFDTAFERNRIYALKESGIKKPWTRDSIFLDSYFCNVFRDRDKVSKWIIENVIKEAENHPQLWGSIVMSRMISRLETLKILKEENALIGDFKKAFKVITELKESGSSVFTGAFIVNSAVGKGVWMDKVHYLFHLLNYLNKLNFDGMNIHEWLSKQTSLETVFYQLKRAPGVANFMAYQYVCDFTYTEPYLKHNKDDKEWVKLGLGAVRGMNRLLYGKVSSNKISNEIEETKKVLRTWNLYSREHLLNQVEQTYEICKLENSEITLEDVSEKYAGFTNLKLQDVQHWLCEYDKYCRGGSSKRRYNGRG